MAEPSHAVDIDARESVADLSINSANYGNKAERDASNKNCCYWLYSINIRGNKNNDKKKN